MHNKDDGMKDLIKEEKKSVREEKFSEPNVLDPDENILEAQAMEKGIGDTDKPIDIDDSGFHIEE